MSESGWVTKLSTIKDGRPTLHGYDLLDVATRHDFSSVVFLACTGELPGEAQRTMLNTVLGSSVIHGVAPTGAIARGLTRSGVPTQVAVSGALLSIGDIHGGAGEQLGRALQAAATAHRYVAGAPYTEQLVGECARHVLRHFDDQGARLPGLGHAAHPEGDPRAPVLLGQAERLGVAGLHCAVLLELERIVAERVGRPIPCNVDGAMAAVFADLGIDWRYARVLLMASRTIGLGAQVVEELDHPTPRWRDALLPHEIYRGPATRELPAER